MTKLTVSVFALFATFPFVLGGCVFFSHTFGKEEAIDQIEFSVGESEGEPQVKALAYFVGNKERKKLSSGDTIMVNDKPMAGQRYNNGIASGYKYVLELDKVNIYELKVKHGGQEIKRQVQRHFFSVSLPSALSVRNDLEIPIKLAAESAGQVYIQISSLNDKDPIFKNDKYRKGLILKSTEAAGKLTVSKDQLGNLKTGQVELQVSCLIGGYSVHFRKKIEITE